MPLTPKREQKDKENIDIKWFLCQSENRSRVINKWEC